MGSKRKGIADAGGITLRVLAGIALLVMLVVNRIEFGFVKEPYGAWKTWFAWRPVIVRGKVHWMTAVERSLSHVPGLVPLKKWVYRPLQRTN